jgi:hypothetical protein
MKCKFEINKDCVQSEAFETWKDDKRETAFLALEVCPECPVYRDDVDGVEERINEKET